MKECNGKSGGMYGKRYKKITVDVELGVYLGNVRKRGKENTS